MRLRIKLEHRPARFGDGVIQIGGELFGIAGRLHDPDGAVWALLGLLDGSRTVDQVVTDLIHRFPDRSVQMVLDGIETLAKAGYLEDVDEPECAALSTWQRERYGRGRALNQWVDREWRDSSWEFQVKLSRARVVLIGVGGVGSTAALALAMSGVGTLHCVEPDVITLSNLNRQILYTEQDLGRRKVEVAVERLRAANSTITVTGEPTRVDSLESLRTLAAEYDVLVVGADRPKAIRSWANQACVATGTPWVFGGYHGPQASLGLYRPGTGPCFECANAADRERDARRPKTGMWLPAEETPQVHAANAATAGMVGNLVAHVVMSVLTGAPPLPVNCQYGYSLATMDHSFITDVERPHPQCPLCNAA
ncbi:HesA/MoeB/ThiF family protein [Amycolatopsis lurida]